MREWNVELGILADPAEAEGLGKNIQVSSGSSPMPAPVYPRPGAEVSSQPSSAGER